MREFESIKECLEYVNSSLIIDLKNHIAPALRPEYADLLHPPAPGIYMQGNFEPLLDLSTPHYLYDRKTHCIGTQVLGVENLTHEYDVSDEYGKVKLTRKMIYLHKEKMSNTPGSNFNAVRAAAFCASEYLRSYAPHSCFKTPYRFEDIFQEKALPLLEEGTLDVFDSLRREIASFIGNDELFIYFFYLNGSVLRIEKNMDYRIYEYYLRKFKDDAE